jgi:hypothetical protein
MPSRRRKRHRRQAEAGRGDRLGAPHPPRSGGPFGLWLGAAAGAEVALVGYPQGWPIPLHRWGPILDEVLDGLDQANGRRVALLGRIAIAADQANMDP